MPQDPYAAYGGQTVTAPPADPYAAYGGSASSPPKIGSREWLLNRANDLTQEEQHQLDIALGPDSENRSYLNRVGHRLLSLAPATAAFADRAVAGLMDWKNAGVVAAGAVDPAIPAAYFGTQGIADLTGLGGGKSSAKEAVKNPTPENVQQALTSGAMVTGAAGAEASPQSGATVRAVPPVARATGRVLTGPAVETAVSKGAAWAGAGVGGAVGHATGIPGAGYIGAGVGGAVGKIAAPSIVARLRFIRTRLGLDDQMGFNFSGRPAESDVAASAELAPTAETLQPAAAAAETAKPEAPAVQPEAEAAPAARQPSSATIPRTDSGEIVLNQALTALDNKTLLKVAKSRGIDVTSEAQLKPAVADQRVIKKIIDDFSPEELDEVRNRGLEASRFKPVQGEASPEAGTEAWHYKVLSTYFPDVQIPKTMQARAQATIANRPTSAQIELQNAPASLPDLLDIAKENGIPTNGETNGSLLKKVVEKVNGKPAEPRVPGANEDMTPLLRQSVEKFKKRGKVSVQ